MDLFSFGSGNYIAVILILAVYSLITNPLLLIAMGFLFGVSYPSLSGGASPEFSRR